jgi:uncharacterized protein YndB with AHSA1/START domain
VFRTRVDRPSIFRRDHRRSNLAPTAADTHYRGSGSRDRQRLRHTAPDADIDAERQAGWTAVLVNAAACRWPRRPAYVLRATARSRTTRPAVADLYYRSIPARGPTARHGRHEPDSNVARSPITRAATPTGPVSPTWTSRRPHLVAERQESDGDVSASRRPGKRYLAIYRWSRRVRTSTTGRSRTYNPTSERLPVGVALTASRLGKRQGRPESHVTVHGVTATASRRGRRCGDGARQERDEVADLVEATEARLTPSALADFGQQRVFLRAPRRFRYSR